MKDTDRIKEIIPLPSKNDYYEKDSADGYAYLGYAYRKLQINDDICYKSIVNRNFSLNARYQINKIIVPKDAIYLYTLWPCIEYLKLRNDKKLINKLIRK